MRYHRVMNGTNRKTLEAIFAKPTRSDIRWSDIESLARALGGEVIERGGSRVGLIVNGVRGNFHRPHPSPDTNKGAVDAVRMFLTNAKVKP